MKRSKERLNEEIKLSNEAVAKVVVSFATRSLVKKTKFKVSRGWIMKFIENNFIVEEDFEVGTERYIVFKKKD